jgi:hypothetical protein
MSLVKDELDEPLFESAPLAHAAARTLCRSDGDAGTSCAWYHGAWQYFRALGIVTAPTVHARGLTEALRALARGGSHSRVLVSGAADYSLLAHVLHAYRCEGCADRADRRRRVRDALLPLSLVRRTSGRRRLDGRGGHPRAPRGIALRRRVHSRVLRQLRFRGASIAGRTMARALAARRPRRYRSTDSAGRR